MAIDYKKNYDMYMARGDKGGANYAAKKLGIAIPFPEYETKLTELATAKQNLQPGQSVLEANKQVGIGAGQSLESITSDTPAANAVIPDLSSLSNLKTIENPDNYTITGGVPKYVEKQTGSLSASTTTGNAGLIGFLDQAGNTQWVSPEYLDQVPPEWTRVSDSLSNITSTGTTQTGTSQTGTTQAAETTPFVGKYDDKILSLLEKYLNPEPFEFNVEESPSYQSYKEQYQREGERAFQDTIGDLTSLTGGRLNTWATSAASQAKNLYSEKLADVIPVLEEQAYNREQSEYANLGNQLAMLQSLNAEDYGRYQDEREFGITEAGVTGTYKGQQTQAAKEAERNFLLNQAGVTGKYKGQQTMQGKSTALSNELTQLQINELKDPNSITNRLNELNVKTAELNYQYLDSEKKLAIEALTQDIESGKINNQIGQAQLKEITDENSVTNQLNKLNLDTAKLNYQYLDKEKQLGIDGLKQDLESGRINQELAQAQLDEYTDPNSISNQLKQKQLDIEGLNYQYYSKTLQDRIKAVNYDLELNRISADTAQKTLDNLGKGLDANGNSLTGLKYTDYVQIGYGMKDKIYTDKYGKSIPVYTDTQVKIWAYSLPISDEQQAKLISDLGYPLPTEEERVTNTKLDDFR